MGQSKPKSITILISLTYFFILMSYPLVRSATGAIFYEYYTSESYSFATFLAIIALMILIGISNAVQNKIGVQRLYLATSLLSVLVMGGAILGLGPEIKELAYVLFATKEAYIVLLVHSCLAYSNAYFSLAELKKYIGPIGAMGSIGGIIGGQITTVLANNVGTNSVLWISFVFILLSGICFYFTKAQQVKGLEKDQSVTPIAAIKGVQKYVILIALIVAISQFVIYIADLQFNVVFEKVVTAKDERTSYLGNFHSIINGLALLLQFIVLPYLLPRFSLRGIFVFIPALYLLLVIFGQAYGAGSLVLIAGIFITMKGMDYSLFAATKDVMYHPLLSIQKFGAKYITDMFVYRLAKALIAFLMAQFAIVELGLMTSIQFVFLAIWIILVLYLFEEQKRLNKKERR